MEKIDFIRQELKRLGVPERTGGTYDKSILDLALLGSRGSNWSSAGATKATKKYFPNKPHGIAIFSYLCDMASVNYCCGCEKLLSLELFSLNKCRRTGRSSWCKLCQKKACGTHYLNNTSDYRAKSAKYKAAKACRTPFWANQEKIKAIYHNCPEGHHVDHIIPLHGELVSGLHVPENLQYLTATENLSKGNKFTTQTICQ